MPTSTFRALIAEGNSRKYTADFKQLETSSLPAAEILVEVAYSSLNYKDALGVTARGKIIHQFPMICGNDLAGTVIESTSSGFRPGDKVLGVGGDSAKSIGAAIAR